MSEQRALLKQGWLIASAGVRRSVPRRPTASSCVVFVHGFMAGGAVLDPLRQHVAASLHVDTIAFDYAPLASFERTAKRLGSVARMAAAGRPTIVIGHSLGGLLARHAIEFEALPSKLLISIATPHRGTRRALRVPGSLGRALRPESAIINALPDESKVPHVSIVAGSDTVVVPLESAAAPGAEVHRLDDVGHNEVLYAPALHALVTDLIESA